VSTAAGSIEELAGVSGEPAKRLRAGEALGLLQLVRVYNDALRPPAAAAGRGGRVLGSRRRVLSPGPPARPNSPG
jgi:hypothetical protein